MDQFVQPLLRSLETGSVYALAALGIIIVWRTSLVMHFAQGSMGMFSGTAVAFALNRWGLPLWQAVLVGLVVAVFLGFAVDFAIIRRLRRATSVGKEIITLGLIMVFLGLAPIIFGTDPMLLPKAIPAGSISLGSASLSYNSLFNIVFGIAVAAALYVVLQKTKLGLAVRATASSDSTARLMGIPTRTVTMFSWATAGVLGMLAAVMIAPATTATPTFMNDVQVTALFACVLGGFQTFYGPVLAAYIIAIVSNFLKLYVSSVWGDQMMFGLILLFLLVRPNGLVGKTYLKKV